jgi:hypothetical protein
MLASGDETSKLSSAMGNIHELQSFHHAFVSMEISR